MRWLASSGRFTGYAMAAAAIFTVLYFGGVEPIGFAPAQLTILLLAMVMFWRGEWPQLSIPTWVVLIFLLTIPALQLLPLPYSFVELLSPHRVQLAGILSNASIPASDIIPLSIYPFETASALIRLACYLLVFLLAVRIYQLTGKQTALMATILALGIFEASYGIVQYLAGWPYLFFYRNANAGGGAFGTFINRNHYAGLLAMILPFLASMTFSQVRSRSSTGKNLWRDMLVSPRTAIHLRNGIAFVIVIIGLLFSLSRMGLVAGLAGISISALMIFHRRRRLALWLMTLFLAVASVFSLWIGISPVLNRFEGLLSTGGADENRLLIWRDTVQLIKDFPLTGTGLGTYNWASNHYQSSMLYLRYEHAHNDILEFGADIGIPAAVVLWGALWYLLFSLIRKARSLEYSSDKVLAAGCAGALVSLLLHSIVDFNLQIPGNAFIFSWIAGASTALVQKRSPAWEIISR